MPGRRLPLVQRLVSKIQVEPGSLDSDCWTWTGAKRGGYGGDKYGSIRPGGRETRMALAHVTAYQLFVGPVPEGTELDHRCRNRLCCNPQHLEPVTREENLLRHSTRYAHEDERVPFEVPESAAVALDWTFFEERAAIREHDGGLPRDTAERLALEDLRRERDELPF